MSQSIFSICRIFKKEFLLEKIVIESLTERLNLIKIDGNANKDRHVMIRNIIDSFGFQDVNKKIF